MESTCTIFIRIAFPLCWLILTSLLATAGDAALPGNHPLTQVQTGDVLISELRCSACHSDALQSPMPEKTAPDLSNVGARVSPEFLRQFLSAPTKAQPGTTMPDVLATQPEAERAQIAEALTHFLVAQSTSVFKAQASEPIDRLQGKTLFHSVGCVACHGPIDAPPSSPPNSTRFEIEEAEDATLAARIAIKPMALSLKHVPGKYNAHSLGEFLFQPLQVRKSGRMPDMRLTPAESLAIAGYLHGESPTVMETLVPKASLVSQGKNYFQDLNCAACHALAGMTAAPVVVSLKNADLSRGCLSKSSVRSPRFELDEHQLAAIVAALRAEPSADSDQAAVAKTLTAFQCIACHERDNYGGVHETYNPYFIGSDLKLGDDGRIPPPLTLVGAKLQPAWMKKVLFDGESVRHYMATRMPQYGSDNLAHLPPLFARLDVLKSKVMNIPSSEGRRSESEREQEKLVRAAGRELLGDKGLNCIACHNFNGKASQANQGIDLVTSFERLQPGWFNRYLRKPGEFRPRTVMPSAWPDDVAAFTTILDGNTDRQIEAIWYYLSLGTSAADPSGIRGGHTKLTVDRQAITYRGRSRVAGFRGIAVGLPEKLSYAFNAETGTLTAIWQGDFISVNWSGQGSGDFNPSSEPIALAQDVSLAQLATDDAPWPLLPVMTKEARTNPNPRYPKNVGYQFKGYYLDESFVPTFMYHSGTIEIADRSVAERIEDHVQLKRVLQIESPEQQTVWFRALTGDISRESERVYHSDRLRLTIPQAAVTLRPLPEDPTKSELLLRLQLPQGKTTLEFVYEPLAK